MAKSFTRSFTPVYIDPSSKEPVMNVAGSVSITGISPITEWDYISASYPDSVTEVYTYKLGGSGGDVVQVITVVYTTSAKNYVSTVTKV